MTRRATHPLDPAAVRAANAAVHDMTNPPGRALSPTDPHDAAARLAWMNAYEAAGGRVVNATRGPPLDNPVMECPLNWIELRYYHCNGSPVPRARYVIEAQGFSAAGVLDDDGFARVEGVPNGLSQVDFRFEDDPEEYVPRPPAAPTDTPDSRSAVQQVFSDVWDWLWGTIQGDFNQDATISQSAVNAVIGLIPIADQVLDARDLIAGMKHLIEYYMEDEEEQRAHPDSLGLSYETWLWVGLFLIAIGCIPTVGSAVKGVLRTIIRILQDASRVAGELSAQQLRRIWESVVAVLNYFGIRQGNAHRWLSELPGRLSGYMDDAARWIRDAGTIFRRFLDNVSEYVGRLRGVWGVDQEWVRRTLTTIERAKGAVDRVLGRLERQKQIINEWLSEQLNRIIGSRGTSGGTGSPNAHPPGAVDGAPSSGPNQVVQQAEPPREPVVPPRRPSTAERMEELRSQGHGPQRHEGQVTRQQLEDRVLRGTDPMTGSHINPDTGQPYDPPRRATRIKDEETYVEAEAQMRNSQEFSTAPVEETASGARRKEVTVPLERAIGSDYQDHVEGVTRIGSVKNPTGTRATDFNDGNMVAVYEENAHGGWDLLTMYPSPVDD